MTSFARTLVRGTVLLLATAAFAGVDLGLEVYKSMGVAATDVLSGTVLTAQVLPGPDKQVVALLTHFTGKRDDADGVDVRLEVFRRNGDALESVYARDYGKENGGFVGRGELELVDLDGDGLNEIIVTYDSAKSRVIEERRGEVLVHDRAGFRAVWTGEMTYDATRAARELPAERRDRFVRKIDPARTRKTRGESLMFTKTTIAVAGERLPEPKVSIEAFPFRKDGP